MSPLGALFILGSLACVVWAVFAYRSERRFLSIAVRANGVVQTNRAERGEKGATYYYPTVSFTTAAGLAVTREASSGRNTPYQIGETIPVSYDPQHPESFELNAFSSRWLVVIGAIFLALVCLGIAAKLLATSGTTPQG